MRMLGFKASLQSFRWDLVYLLAQLLADKRAEVAALAPPVQSMLDKLKAERDAFEQAEDAVIVATAVHNKRDRDRDAVLIEAGGVARAVSKEVYETLFLMSPSATARLGVDAESAEVDRILGELGKLPADHPVRTAYEKELADVEGEVKVAGAKSDLMGTALALQRSQLDRFKLAVDRQRLETHGQLLVLLKDKAEADSFFRPGTKAPEDEPAAGSPPATPTPPAP